MASFIKIKRSETSGNPAVLGAGELAYSGLADNGSNGGDRLYIGMGTETAGNAVNHVVIGGKYFTDQITAATNENTANTIVRRNSAGGFTAGLIIADLLGNADTATSWKTSRNLTLSGDASATFLNVDGTSNVFAQVTLATVNQTAGIFGSTTAIPIITVNDKGLITNVTTASISTSFNVAGDTGTAAVNSGNTLIVSGGTGVTTVAATGPEITISIGQSVSPTDNVIFNNIIATGALSSNSVSADSLDISGNAVITGNLIVQGTTTTINSVAVEIADVNLTLAKNAATSVEANGAGLTVLGPTVPATFTYSNTDDRWNLNKDLNVANIYGALTGNASTATKLATARAITATGDAGWTVNFDGSAAASATITLATVNSNIGAFGSSTTVPTITVNAKGLVTAVSTTAIPTASTSVSGLARFDANNFVVTSGLVTIALVDGGTY